MYKIKKTNYGYYKVQRKLLCFLKEYDIYFLTKQEAQDWIQKRWFRRLFK